MALIYPDGSWTPLCRDLAQTYPGLDECDIRLTIESVALSDASEADLWKHAQREGIEEAVRQVIEAAKRMKTTKRRVEDLTDYIEARYSDGGGQRRLSR